MYSRKPVELGWIRLPKSVKTEQATDKHPNSYHCWDHPPFQSIWLFFRCRTGLRWQWNGRKALSDGLLCCTTMSDFLSLWLENTFVCWIIISKCMLTVLHFYSFQQFLTHCCGLVKIPQRKQNQQHVYYLCIYHNVTDLCMYLYFCLPIVKQSVPHCHHLSIRFTLKNWVTRLWGLASSNSAG